LERGYFGRSILKKYGSFGASPDVLQAAIIADEVGKAEL
jgi:hypothetical protein